MHFFWIDSSVKKKHFLNLMLRGSFFPILRRSLIFLGWLFAIFVEHKTIQLGHFFLCVWMKIGNELTERTLKGLFSWKYLRKNERQKTTFACTQKSKRKSMHNHHHQASQLLCSARECTLIAFSHCRALHSPPFPPPCFALCAHLDTFAACTRHTAMPP